MDDIFNNQDINSISNWIKTDISYKKLLVYTIVHGTLSSLNSHLRVYLYTTNKT